MGYIGNYSSNRCTVPFDLCRGGFHISHVPQQKRYARSSTAYRRQHGSAKSADLKQQSESKAYDRNDNQWQWLRYVPENEITI